MQHRAVRAAIVVLAAVSAGVALGRGPTDPGSHPGQLAILPDHRKLNFRCEGQGAPTVLLESGFGANSLAWYRVAPRIAEVTRVCAYDRAGYGYSDPGPMPRDGEAIARDLDAGLKAAHINGPFVLVGHSAGGLYQRLFAARRRRDILGLVFVDSSVEHQVQRVQAITGQNVQNIMAGLERRPMVCLQATSQPKISADDPAVAACVGKDEGRQKAIDLRPDTWRTQVSELDTLFTMTSDEVDRVGSLLSGIPVVVLTAGEVDASVPPAAPVDPWTGFHRQLAEGFLKHDHRMVKSGHLMMIERPEVVADAALSLVQAVRKPTPP